MSRNSLNTAAGKRLFGRFTKDPGSMPFSFRYGGKLYKGFGDLKPRRMTAGGGGITRVTVAAKVDASLRLSAEIGFDSEYGEVEYTVWLENCGRKPTEVISELRALDGTFEGDRPLLRSCMGDHDNWYSAYEQDLTKGDKYFLSTGGRATHTVFPYFDLVHGGGGTMIALGWAGTWEALFSHRRGVTAVRAKTDISLNTVLLPGEKIRSGQVVLLPYKGRDRDDASNLWREWYMERLAPSFGAGEGRLRPFSASCFAGDTGLPNSDGSISERSYTWEPTLKKVVEEGIVPDFRWFDAGWYADPAGNSAETDWWGTVGSWEPDPVKWPDGALLRSNEACHAAGMKVLCWFEPERVTGVEDLVKNYGYKEEWSIGEGSVRTNDLGDPECLAWTLGRITKMMGENGIDLYREDNNSDPGYAWPYNDRKEAEKHGLPRAGITENKCIIGHYALWDGIIAYCRDNGKCTFVDSCASGGGRNDIESMRRGIPLLRSDYDRSVTSIRLSMTSSFCRWIPFNGASTWDANGEADGTPGGGHSVYASRASLLPVYNYSAEYTHDSSLDFGLLRRNIAEWRKISPLLTKDFYVLTPWHHELDRDDWTVFAYDSPESGESVLLAFRMEDAEEDTFTAKLKFARPGMQYVVENADTGEIRKLGGSKLNGGLEITLPEKKSSAVFFIRLDR